MIRDITIGQYVCGNSVLHRLDPRTKILSTVSYIFALFLINGLWCYVFNFSLILIFYLICGISLKMVLNNVKPILPILILTSIINLWVIRDGEVVFSFWIFSLTDRAIFFTSIIFFRLILLIFSSSLLTYTTLPTDLTRGIEKMIKPLAKIRFPVEEISMMISIALRFIPTLILEADKIICAQKSRGLDMETGSFIKRAKCMVPILIPLFVCAFKRADELAVAMESRCYRVGGQRTSYRTLSFKKLDIFFALGFLAVLTMVLMINAFFR